MIKMDNYGLFKWRDIVEFCIENGDKCVGLFGGVLGREGVSYGS